MAKDLECSYHVMMEILSVEMDVQATVALKLDGHVLEVLLIPQIDVLT